MFDFIDPDRSIKAHRNPTPSEMRFGHGATHYKDFPRSMWQVFTVAGKHKFSCLDDANESAQRIFKNTGAIVSIESKIKKWIVCPIDGLRYYR